jgi:hypothetical protein
VAARGTGCEEAVMGRRKSGGSITLKGGAANAFMAMAEASYVLDLDEARAKFVGAGTGPYGIALRVALLAKFPALKAEAEAQKQEG